MRSRSHVAARWPLCSVAHLICARMFCARKLVRRLLCHAFWLEIVHVNSRKQHSVALALACGGEVATVFRGVLNLRSQALRSQAPIALVLAPTLTHVCGPTRCTRRFLCLRVLQAKNGQGRTNSLPFVPLLLHLQVWSWPCSRIALACLLVSGGEPPFWSHS